MDILLNPNVAYLLLVAGILFSLTAIMTPGTGIPETLAFFSIVLAGYAVYHISFHWWALVVLILSMLPFYRSIRSPRRAGWLILSIAGLTVGSVFFFPAASSLSSVHPALALATTSAYSVFLWIATRKVVEIAHTRPVHELSGLVGRVGEAKTIIHEEGSVQVAGELWSARSQKPIEAGSVVRVTGRDGFPSESATALGVANRVQLVAAVLTQVASLATRSIPVLTTMCSSPSPTL